MSSTSAKSVLAVILSLSLVCIGWSLWHGRKTETGELRFVQPCLWLGNVTRDQTVPFTFEIKNDSNKAVKIVSAEASCRCTTLESAPAEIPSHGTGLFKWTFGASRSAGFEEKEVTIETADGRNLVGKFQVWVDAPDINAGTPGPAS